MLAVNWTTSNIAYLAFSSVKDIVLLQYFRPVAINFFGETRVFNALLLHQRLHLDSQTDHVTQQQAVTVTSQRCVVAVSLSQFNVDYSLSLRIRCHNFYLCQQGRCYVIILSVCHSVILWTGLLKKVMSRFHWNLGLMIGHTNRKNWLTFSGAPASGPRYGFRITFPFSSPLQNRGF